jgi:hypothetical protein
MSRRILTTAALPAMVFTIVWIVISLLLDGPAWYIGIFGGFVWFLTALLMDRILRRR